MMAMQYKSWSADILDEYYRGANKAFHVAAKNEWGRGGGGGDINMTWLYERYKGRLVIRSKWYGKYLINQIKYSSFVNGCQQKRRFILNNYYKQQRWVYFSSFRTSASGEIIISQ